METNISKIVYQFRLGIKGDKEIYLLLQFEIEKPESCRIQDSGSSDYLKIVNLNHAQDWGVSFNVSDGLLSLPDNRYSERATSTISNTSSVSPSMISL